MESTIGIRPRCDRGRTSIVTLAIGRLRAALASIAAVLGAGRIRQPLLGKYHWARTASDGSFTLDLA
jgi:hypothetical protein